MELITLFTALMFLSCSGSAAQRPLLAQLEEYVAVHEEYPDGDTSDWKNQTYAHFYQKLRPSKIATLLQKIGIGTTPGTWWSPGQLVRLLQKSVAEMQGDYDTVYALQVTEALPTQYIVLTDVLGALHSLVRCLQHLQHEGTISQDLVITKDNVILIFNGNVIDQSPYVLETLALVLMLIERNPGKVLYLRGAAEEDTIWIDRALGNAIRAHLGTKESTIFDLLKQYFQFLPKAFYIVQARDANSNARKIQAIRVSSTAGPRNILDESLMGDFFETLTPFVMNKYSYLHKKRSENSVSVRVFIEGYEELFTKKPIMPYSFFIEEDAPIAHWQLCSAQNRVYRQLYRFFYDAYALLRVQTQPVISGTTNAFKPSTISLVYNDVRTPFAWSSLCFSLSQGKHLETPCAI